MGGAVSDLHCRLLYRFIHIISIKTLVIMDTQKRRVLVLNPNSSKAMTEGMVKAIGEVQLPSTVEIGTYTAPPEAPSSINDDNDIEASTNAVVTSLAKGAADFNQYDAMLVACYSVHPLVQKLSHAFPRAAVTGIIEGQPQNFAGVFTTGLNAGDFHHVPEEEVTRRLSQATKKLLETGNVRCVVMGCAGMAGLERIIRSAAADVQGAESSRALYVVDGVKAGMLQLEQAMQSKRYFS